MIRRLFTIVFIVLIGLAPSATYAAGGASILAVTVDHGVPLTLSGPATSVFIANPDIADVQVMSPTSIMVFGKRTGETSFMASDAAGKTLSQRTVIVTQDLSYLRRELDVAIPGNNIKVESLPNGMVLTGDAKDPASVADAYKIAMRYIPAGGDIINRIRVAGSNQIMIRVRFAEVSRTVDNTLGIDWDSAATFGGFAFGIGSGAGIVVDSATGGIVRPSNSSLTESNDIISFGHKGARTNINNLIDALARHGLVTVLAEPNLTAMSGETASFLAGGEIPVPIPQTSSGNNTVITVEWKPYGISLQFTPTLLSGDRISLHVKPEVSQLTQVGAITTDNITIPGLTTRKAETTVEVGSGQSFAIAGMMDNSQAQTIDKYPILGDMPIIGPLFRSTHFQNGQTELVVIITPYVVKPSNTQLALPMDNYSPPDQTEALVGLRYSSGDPSKRPVSGQPVGRRVDPSEPAAPLAAPVTPVTSPNYTSGAVLPAPTETQAPGPVSSRNNGSQDAQTITVLPSPPGGQSPGAAPGAAAGASSAAPTNLTPAGPGGFVVE